MPILKRYFAKVDPDLPSHPKCCEVGGVATICYQYLIGLAHTRSDDGWVDLKYWEAWRIWHWGTAYHDLCKRDDIQPAMDKLEGFLVETKDGKVKPIGHDKWIKKVEASCAAERKRTSRMNQNLIQMSQSECDMSQPVTPGSQSKCDKSQTESDMSHRRVEESREEDNIYISSNEHESTSKTNDVYDNNTNNEVGEDTLGGMTGEEIKTLFDGKMAALAWTILDGWNQYPPHSCLETAVQLGAYWNGKLTIKNMVDITEKAIASWPPGRSLHQGNGLHGFISSFFSNEHERMSRGRH